VQGANAAEVEVVIDNHDGALDLDFSRSRSCAKLDRDGEGEYRLNGARCRLVDVVEVLSDSGSARRCTRSSRRARSSRSSCRARASGG
jgi:chromosome segregation protein